MTFNTFQLNASEFDLSICMYTLVYRLPVHPCSIKREYSAIAMKFIHVIRYQYSMLDTEDEVFSIYHSLTEHTQKNYVKL